MKGDRRADYLAHMIDAARVAMSYAEDREKPQFLSDRRTQQAVLPNIMVIGEAATQLAQTAPDVVNACPDVPWQNLRGMRNRVAHGYFDSDLEVVWNTVKIAMPALLPLLLAAQTKMAGSAAD